MSRVNKNYSSSISYGIITENRRAYYNYIVEKVVEAGLVLVGSEVKALRLGRCTITECYATQQDNELYLLNAYIPEYQGGVDSHLSHAARRPRKLLLRSKEIKQLRGAINQMGMSIIPLAIYFNSRGIAKVRLGLARGKKLPDKREAIRKRDWQLEKSRLIRWKNKTGL